MSNRSLKVIGGLLGGVAALLVTLAALCGMAIGLLGDTATEAYGSSAAIIGGADGPTVIYSQGLMRFVVFLVLVVVVCLAGVVAIIAVLRNRKRASRVQEDGEEAS